MLTTIMFSHVLIRVTTGMTLKQNKQQQVHTVECFGHRARTHFLQGFHSEGGAKLVEWIKLDPMSLM